MPVTGGPALSVASDSGVSRGASWGADGTIVFATNATGTGLLRVPSGGGTPEVLTTPDPKQGEIDHVFPEILPDGRTVLFTILSLGSVDNAQIAVVDLKTRERKVLLRGGRHAQYASSGHLVFGVGNTLRAVAFDAERLEVLSDPQPVLDQVATVATGAMNVAMARDGTLLYIPGGMMDVAQRTLVWVDRQGNEQPIDAPARSYQVPRASPDGTRLAAQVDDPSSSDIAVYDLQRKTLVRLTFGKTSSIRPMWTPDSRWVFFRSDVDGPGIYRKAGDGSGEIERIVGVKGDGGPHNVSPDGKTLVFSQVDPTTGRDLWMLDLAGDRTPRTLVVEPGPQSNGVISPDGRWLAYHSEDVGATFVRPFPDTGGGRWEVVPSGSKWPLWSRDGRELFYVSAQGMMAVDVETSQQTFRWKSPRVLFPASYYGFVGLAGARNYDLSPDGKRFLLIKDKVREQSAAALVVIQNWSEELKVLAPAKR
jgi:serine/threonine-protein kinase